MVRAARHAVAIDERRRTFPPTLWDNLDGAERRRRAEAPYAQRWFPGDHGSVGGGGTVTALSDDALVWVAEGAAAAGLALDPAALAAGGAGRDCLRAAAARAARCCVRRLLTLDSRDRRGAGAAGRPGRGGGAALAARSGLPAAGAGAGRGGGSTRGDAACRHARAGTRAGTWRRMRRGGSSAAARERGGRWA